MNIQRALVIGAGSGVGLATADALAPPARGGRIRQ